jgi:hypothetical protein
LGTYAAEQLSFHLDVGRGTRHDGTMARSRRRNETTGSSNRQAADAQQEKRRNDKSIGSLCFHLLFVPTPAFVLKA